MTISNRTREQAAQICSALASDPRLGPETACAAFVDRWSETLYQLVTEANWSAACVTRRLDNYAEAEALLRTGWSPGEDVP